MRVEGKGVRQYREDLRFGELVLGDLAPVSIVQRQEKSGEKKGKDKSEMPDCGTLPTLLSLPDGSRYSSRFVTGSCLAMTWASPRADRPLQG